MSPGRLHRADVDYHWGRATVECEVREEYGRLIRFAEEPTMRGVDMSPQVDWQTVAWSAVLYRLRGADWVPEQQTIWLYDRTRDIQFDARFGFAGNFWRRFEDNRRVFVFFQPSEPGSYRVGVLLHWYEEGSLPSHTELHWAGKHFGDFEDPSHTHLYCLYPA
jgi:hypothetical protein